MATEDSTRGVTPLEPGYKSEAASASSAPATQWPGVMHTGAQSVVRDGVQILTDRPLKSDAPVPGRHFTFMPTVW